MFGELRVGAGAHATQRGHRGGAGKPGTKQSRIRASTAPSRPTRPSTDGFLGSKPNSVLLQEKGRLAGSDTVAPLRTPRQPATAKWFDFGSNKGVDDFRQEQLVTDFLNTNKRITRAEVEELCRVDTSQADYLLRRLREEGQISLGQRGRYAYYVPGGSWPNSESNSEK